MQPSTETKIWLAIRSRIETIPVDFAKAWPAESFTPPSADGVLEPYLRIARVTVDPVPVLIDGGKAHARAGTLMVTLVHPLGQDVSVYDEYAGRIAEHFADSTNMRYNNVCVRVTAHPHVQPGYEDNGYFTVPISIPWRTYA